MDRKDFDIYKFYNKKVSVTTNDSRCLFPSPTKGIFEGYTSKGIYVVQRTYHGIHVQIFIAWDRIVSIDLV